MHHLWPAAAVLLVSGGVIVLGLSPEPPLPENIFFFLGRFHPLVVHLPIGLLAALAVLQGVQWAFRWDLDRAIRVLLWLCAASAVASTLFGTLLAWPGGYSGDLLGLHRWAGIGTTIVAVWMLWAHHLRGAAGRAVYAALLLLALVLVGAAGHFGGSLTHGEDYLTAYLPEALGGAPEPAPLDTGSKEDAAVYAAAVRPVLEAKCVECHNATKSNGELRMDTLAGLLAGDVVPLAVDIDAVPADLLRQHRIEAPPTILVLDVDGSELGRIPGYMPPSGFLRVVESFLPPAEGH
ncbi:MAG: c-type cytochrome domain-containing protein, partial [Chthoniobacterales bacterium]